MRITKRMFSTFIAISVILSMLVIPSRAVVIENSNEDASIQQIYSTACTQGLHLEFLPDQVYNRLYETNTIYLEFYISGLETGQSCTLQIDSTMTVTHTLDTQEVYTKDNNYVSFAIQVLDQETILQVDSMYLADYEYITITATTNDNDPKVKITRLNVLNSQYGMFVGITNEEALFDYAAKYLYDNNVINKDTYDAARASAYCLPSTVQMQQNAAQLQSTTVTAAVQGTTVEITYSINALDSGARLNVAGYVFWTDIDGTKYPARRVLVKVLDEDTFSDDVVGTYFTTNMGWFTVTFDNQVSLESGCDIFLEVLPQSENIEVISTESQSFVIDTSAVHGVNSNVTASVASKTLLCGASNKTKAFQIHQAAYVGSFYAEQVKGAAANNVEIRYPANEAKYYMMDSYITIPQNTYYSWDVILHEYGHHIAYTNGIDQTPGGAHTGTEDLIVKQGNKDAGCRLAWSEGWATFFGIAAQQMTYAESLGVPGVGDDTYHSYDINITTNGETDIGKGEGNETAIFCSLWDFADSTTNNDDSISESFDGISLGFNVVVNYSLSSQAKAFSGFLNYLMTQIGNTAINRRNIGGVLSNQRFAASMLSFDEISEFSFVGAYGSNLNPMTYHLEIYDSSTMNLVYAQSIGTWSSAMPTISYVPPDNILQDLVSYYGDGFIWCIKTVTAGTSYAPSTSYYSEFVSSSMSEWR